MWQQWGGDGEVAIGVEGRVDVAGNGSDNNGGNNGGVNAHGSGNGGSGDGGGDNNGCGDGGRGGAVRRHCTLIVLRAIIGL